MTYISQRHLRGWRAARDAATHASLLDMFPDLDFMIVRLCQIEVVLLLFLIWQWVKSHENPVGNCQIAGKCSFISPKDGIWLLNFMVGEASCARRLCSPKICIAPVGDHLCSCGAPSMPQPLFMAFLRSLVFRCFHLKQKSSLSHSIPILQSYMVLADYK